jgi:hypothetical protein
LRAAGGGLRTGLSSSPFRHLDITDDGFPEAMPNVVDKAYQKPWGFMKMKVQCFAEAKVK